MVNRKKRGTIVPKKMAGHLELSGKRGISSLLLHFFFSQKYRRNKNFFLLVRSWSLGAPARDKERETSTRVRIFSGSVRSVASNESTMAGTGEKDGSGPGKRHEKKKEAVKERRNEQAETRMERKDKGFFFPPGTGRNEYLILY